MPIGATTSSPTPSAAGGKIWAILGAPRVTVRSALTLGPMSSKLSAESPDGMSTATLKAPAPIDVLDREGIEAVERLGQPGAEERVDHDRGVKDGHPRLLPFGGRPDLGHGDARLERGGQVDGRIALDLVLGREKQDLGPAAGIEEVPGDDEAVAAVVALPGDDDDLLAGDPREPGLQGPDDPQAGVLHEHDARGCRSPRSPSGRSPSFEPRSGSSWVLLTGGAGLGTSVPPGPAYFSTS